MAFAFVRAHPFEGESCFVRRSGGGSSCAASCHASARAGACASTGPGRRSRGGSCFSFGDETREFEVVDTPESYFIFFDATGKASIHRTSALRAQKATVFSTETLGAVLPKAIFLGLELV